MKRYVPDTNVFIQAIRNVEVRRELAEWQRSMAPYIWQHSVVVSELLVGARDERTWGRWHEGWVAPAERVGRLVVPRYGTWLRASRFVTRLVEMGRVSPGGVKSSFFNDCLLAAGSSEHGYAIVTFNLADFELIALAEPSVRVHSPFP